MRGSLEAVRERTLTWEGCLNVRDLGGHATADGGTTRWGAVVRADSIRRLSDAGWDALAAYGVTRIVDLRFHSELEADPPAELPVEVLHLPLFDEEGMEPVDAAPTSRDFYLEALERFRPNFALAVRTVADAPDGTVLVHCQGGKDRTGLVVALLLRLVGVAAETIGEDYALSASNLAPVIEEWIAEAPDEVAREFRIRVGAGPPEQMVDVLAELERRYGSVERYLLGAGATEADLERVRARLRG
jgi:protein-tyrosine phosphatase